ncbi:MAG TPA: hypothetical protein VKE51_23110 [Vicinamibacterales bacterium]|nr:hypothetical protein [Vicinamibacterales bacterium]
MRRIVARGKKAQKNHQPTRSLKGRRAKKVTPSPTIVSTAPIVLAVIGIIATGGFLAARQASRPRDAAVAEPQAALQAQLLTMPAPAASDAKKILPSRTTTAVAAIKTNPPAPTVVVKPSPEPAGRRKPAPLEAVSERRPEASELPAKEVTVTPTSAAPAATKAKSDIDESPVVTVTGCLEGGESGFRLKETSGVDGLKSRSWKTGFLTKRSPSIELVDAADTLTLPTLVGQRVSATGTLVNREMRVRSLQSVSPSCR